MSQQNLLSSFLVGYQSLFSDKGHYKHMQTYWVYILTNQHRTVRYVGLTNNLRRRLQEHLEGQVSISSFTGKYKAHHLIYHETFTDASAASAREQQIKRWSRVKKDALIAIANPTFDFLEHLI
jgi:putative endonuclease